MLRLLNLKLRRLSSRFRWPLRRRLKTKPSTKRFWKLVSKPPKTNPASAGNEISRNGSAETVHPAAKTIRVATFNAALFSMAPVTPKFETFDCNGEIHHVAKTLRAKSANDRPKSILKQSPLRPNPTKCTDNLSNPQKFGKSKLRVSINLPDNEISLLRSRQLSCVDDENRVPEGKASLRSYSVNGVFGESFRSSRTILEVLREVDADVLALQEVKAEEEKAMKPLSDLAAALGMSYVFAESWAPEYGNAILSKWPIKKWKVQKIFDDTDFRNVLKATIDVPHNGGEVNIHCTHLDHLNEDWRMKQVDAIINSRDGPHILAGGLNSLDESDYSQERWSDIAKYYEEMGKPAPKVEVMRYLKGKQYTDAKEFAGECESVVMIAKGQSVQGTCRYGTRMDYILASPNCAYKFVPGSYSVVSSKGTSDHHIVAVELVRVKNEEDIVGSKCEPQHHGQKVMKARPRASCPTPAKCIWSTHTT